MTATPRQTAQTSLTRFAWLSIAAAVLTIVLKAIAYWLTGSVGLLSDALESLVNLVAAIMALAMLTLAARPADEEHAYGHTKAEYFSSGVEGALIVLAAVSIGWAAWPRLLQPQPIEQPGLGLAISVAASVLNFIVARILLTAGHRYQSITLEADAHHLMTDVWTSAGVLIGVGAVVLTGWERLDPIIALLVAANIIWTGVQLVRRSAHGLLDTGLPAAELAAIRQVLDRYAQPNVQFHALRTRQAGARRFVSLHVLVPGDWTVHHGHSLLEQIERDIRAVLPNTTVFTHLEALDDPTSWQDTTLDRADAVEQRTTAQP
ncbi:MAG TPA: cation diffusion facilitator family transporter [Roseiflexaceae bacterium]|nr:cation diffusion facilitator family transporter [Roseiflexaceae bacterium]